MITGLIALSLFEFFLPRSDQMRSVTQSCPTLCDPMNRSTPSLPVQHQLPEFTETHVHWVNDAIQPSHPLSFPSPLAPNPPSITVFSNESTLSMRWPKYWSFSFSIIPSKEIPGLISLRMDWLDLRPINLVPFCNQRVLQTGAPSNKICPCSAHAMCNSVGIPIFLLLWFYYIYI